MATLYPAELDKETVSKRPGEKIIFDIFNESKDTENWIILHSLNLPIHITQGYGEIDFLVLAPNIGIICLEVKSGNISRKLGVWKYDKNQGEKSKDKSPIVQVKDNMFSLIKRVEDHFGASSREAKLLYCYGVMFPEYSFKKEDYDIEFEQPLVFDRLSRNKPIKDYIVGVAKYTQNKLSKHYPKFKKLPPTNEDINNLLKFFRPNFEKEATLKDKLEDSDLKITAFTQKQSRCLDQLERNPRMIIQGIAGTGKTVLAIESARRSISRGKKVLFVCFNRLLGYFIGREIEAFKKEFNDNYSFAGPFLEYLEFVLPNSYEIQKNQKDKHKYYNKELPKAFLQFIKNNKFKKFDKLIVDEAQDLVRNYYLEIFDSILKGGFAKGNWELYYDFEKQNVFNRKVSEDKLLKFLNEKTNGNLSQFILTENCRNSNLISSEIGKLFGLEKSTYFNPELGEGKVITKYYDTKEEGAKVLEGILYELVNKEKISPSKITILSYHRWKDSLVRLINTNYYPIYNLSDDPIKFFDGSKISFANVYKFKGMENGCIILVDIDSGINLYKDKNLLEKILYNGMSRAKFYLVLLIEKNMKYKLDDIREKNLIKNKI